MKRFVTLILALVLIFSVTVSSAEFPLDENEKKYVGSWSMYAKNGKGTIYAFLITFLENGDVVQRTMTFKNNKLTSDNKSSGDWIGITDNSIVLSLAGTDMAAMIKDNGYLYLYFMKDFSLCGIYAKCPDMTETLGW